MKDRINKIMEAESLSPARFADEIGVQRSSISHILSGRNKPSYDFIIKIMNRFSGINAEWLLTGKGTMIKSAGQPEERSAIQSSLFDGHTDINSDKKTKKNIITHENSLEYQQNEIAHSPINAAAEKEVTDKEIMPVKRFTNVNKVKYIMFFYDDGSFEQFMPR